MSFLDGYVVPEAFKEAWAIEFEYSPDSVEHLTKLMRWVRHPIIALGGDEVARVAAHELVAWFASALLAEDGQTRMHNLERAMKAADGDSYPSTTKATAMLVYLALVVTGRDGITKRLVWDHVKKEYQRFGLPVPQNRARTLADAGLGDLPEAPSGRPVRQLEMAFMRLGGLVNLR